MSANDKVRAPSAKKGKRERIYGLEAFWAMLGAMFRGDVPSAIAASRQFGHPSAQSALESAARNI